MRLHDCSPPANDLAVAHPIAVPAGKDGDESDDDVESWPSTSTSTSTSSSSSSLSSMGEIRDIVLDLHALVHATPSSPPSSKPKPRKVQQPRPRTKVTPKQPEAHEGVEDAEKATGAGEAGGGPADDGRPPHAVVDRAGDGPGGGCEGSGTGGNDGVVDDEVKVDPSSPRRVDACPPAPLMADDWSFSSVEVDEEENEVVDEVVDEVDDDRPNRGREDSGNLDPSDGNRGETSAEGVSGGLRSSVDDGMTETTTTTTRGSKKEDGDVAISAIQHPPHVQEREGPNGFDGEDKEEDEEEEKGEVVVANGTSAITMMEKTTMTQATAIAPKTAHYESSDSVYDGDDTDERRRHDNDDYDDDDTARRARREELHRRWDVQLDLAARSLVASTRAAAAAKKASSSSSSSSSFSANAGHDGDGSRVMGGDDDNDDNDQDEAASRLLARRIRLFYGSLVLAHCEGVDEGRARVDASEEEGGDGEDAPGDDDGHRRERRWRRQRHHDSHLGLYRRYYRDNVLPSITARGGGSGTTTDDSSFVPMAAARLLWEEVCLSVTDDRDGGGGDDGGGDGECRLDLEAILTHAFVGREGGRPHHPDTSPNSKLGPNLDVDAEENDFVPLLLLRQPATATMDDGVDGDECDGDGGRDDDDASSRASPPSLRGCLLGDTLLQLPPSFGGDVYRDYAIHLLACDGGRVDHAGGDGDEGGGEGGRTGGRGEEGSAVAHTAAAAAAPSASGAAREELEALLVAVRACRRHVLAEHGGVEEQAAPDADASDEKDTSMAVSSSSPHDNYYALLILPYLLLRASAASSSVLATDEYGRDAQRASLFFDGDHSSTDDCDASNVIAAAPSTRPTRCRRARMLRLRERLLASAGMLLLRSRWFLNRRMEAALLLLGAARKPEDDDDDDDDDSRARRVAMEAVELHVVDVELWMLLLLAASSSDDGGVGGGGAIAALAADVGGGDRGDPSTSADGEKHGIDHEWDVLDTMSDLIGDDGTLSGGGGRGRAVPPADRDEGELVPPYGSAAVYEGYQLLLSCLERWNERDGDGHGDDDDSDDGDEMGKARRTPSVPEANLTPSTLLQVLGQTSHLLAQSLSARHLLLSRAANVSAAAAASASLHGGCDENQEDDEDRNNNERNYDDGAMTLYGRALHYYGLLGSSLSGSSTRPGPGEDREGDGDESPWDWMEDGWSDDDISGCGGVDDDGSEAGDAHGVSEAADSLRHDRHHHNSCITQRDVNDMRAIVLCHMGQHSEVFEDYRSAITYYGEAVLIWRNPNLWRYKLSTLSGNHWEDYESFNELDDDDGSYGEDGSDGKGPGSTGRRRHRRHRHRGPNSNVCIGDMLHRLGVAHAYLGEFDKAVECLKASAEIRKKLVVAVRGKDGDVVEGDGGEKVDGGGCCGTPALERMLHHHRYHEDTLTLSSSLGWRRRSLQRGDGLSLGDLNGEAGVGSSSSSSSAPHRCCTASSLRRRREMDLADTLQWLATCHRELGESDLAQTSFKDCLLIKTRIHGRNHVEVASLYYYIGIVYDDMGRHELSLEHYQDAVRIRRHVEAAFDSADEKKMEVCSNGSSRGREAAYVVAAEDERMLARRENGHEMVNAFVCMGNIFLNIWKRKLEALEYFSEAIRLSELLMDMWAVERGIDEAYSLGGVGWSATATTLSAVDDGTQTSDSTLAPTSSAPLQVENEHGEYERMLECYQILLDIVVSLDSKDGRRRPSCGTSTEILHGIARVHMAQRKWDDALLVLRRKLSILHDKWKDHPHAAGHAPKENKVALEAEYENTLYVIGHVMFKLRQFDHAIQSYNDVLVAWRTKCDPGETSAFSTQIVCALHNKGNCHRELREYDQAMKCFEEVSTLVEDLLSLKYDERIALVRANNWYQLANVQLLQCNGTMAVRYLEKSHNFLNEHYGRNHLGVGLCLQGMGEVHHQAKRHYRALECYLEAARVYRIAAAMGHGGSSYDAGFAGEISHFMGDAMHNIGAIHEEKEELDGAMANYEEALRLYRSKFGSAHLSIAKTLANMARICVKQHGYLKAEEMLGEALSIRREILGTDHQDVAKTLMSLGRVHDELHSRQSEVRGGSSKAMSCYEEALRVRRKTLGEHHPDVAASWNMVGRIYTKLQEYDRAFECLEKALVLRQELLGHSHQDTASTYHNLGNAHAMRGAYGKALEFYMSAYGIKSSKKDDRDHMSLSSTCHNIASVHSMLGDTSKARMWYERALEIREKNMPESEALAQTLYKLGALELEMKNYDVALERFRRSMEIMRLQCDESVKFELASILNDIATVCALHKKDFEQAIECCAEVVQIMDSNGRGDSEEVANAQNMLGYIYSNKAESYYNVDMAIRCHESALSILRKKNEANDTACIAKTLCSLGVCYVNSLRELGNSTTKPDNDDVNKAMEYLSECISIFKHQVHSKERRFQSADRTRELARAFYFKGLLHVQSANNETEEKDDAEALKCFEESLDLFRAVTDEASTTDAFIKARVLQKLGMMSTKCRDYDRAMLCFGEALQLGLRAYHSDQDEEELSFRCEYDYDEGFAGVKEKGVAVAEIYFGMGIVSCERRDHDYEKSLYFYQKCLETRQKNLGPQHMDVAQTLNNIGSVYARQKKYGEAMDYWMQALKMYKETGLSDTDEKFKCTLSNIELAEKLVTVPQQVTSEKKPLMNPPTRETLID